MGKRKMTIKEVSDYLNPNVQERPPQIENFQDFQRLIADHYYVHNYEHEFEKTDSFWGEKEYRIIAKNIITEWGKLCEQSKK